MGTDISRTFSDFVANLKYSDLPDDVVETTKLFIADYFASCCAGYMLNQSFNDSVKSILFDMGGKQESGVLFESIKLPALNAAFANATYAHGADMDDGSRTAMGHVAASVMSSVFALAETLDGVKGEDIILAINCGYEMFCRLGTSVQPGLVGRGLHATGVIGSIASGVACAKLLGLDSDGIYNALSLSAIQSSGLLLITESGQSCKPINPANAARSGMFSAKMASSGIEAPANPLQSKKGWFHAVSDSLDESLATERLGEVFSIADCYLKPYPSCRHTHCGIDCALSIRDHLPELGKTIDDIAHINVFIYRNAINIAGIEIPKTSDEKKFSIHYSLATALLKGHFDLDDVNGVTIEDDAMDLVKKIQLIEDQSMENREKGIRGSKVVVVFKDGTECEETVLIPKGDAANRFTWLDMEAKLKGCSMGLLDPQGVDRVLSNIRSMDEMERFDSISQLFGDWC